MNEKACHPRPVGISDKQRTEHQWQVKASESRELSADQHRGQRGSGDEPEDPPTQPVHRINFHI